MVAGKITSPQRGRPSAVSDSVVLRAKAGVTRPRSGPAAAKASDVEGYMETS